MHRGYCFCDDTRLHSNLLTKICLFMALECQVVRNNSACCVSLTHTFARVTLSDSEGMDYNYGCQFSALN